MSHIRSENWIEVRAREQLHTTTCHPEALRDLFIWPVKRLILKEINSHGINIGCTFSGRGWHSRDRFHSHARISGGVNTDSPALLEDLLQGRFPRCSFFADAYSHCQSHIAVLHRVCKLAGFAGTLLIIDRRKPWNLPYASTFKSRFVLSSLRNSSVFVRASPRLLISSAMALEYFSAELSSCAENFIA